MSSINVIAGVGVKLGLGEADGGICGWRGDSGNGRNDGLLGKGVCDRFGSEEGRFLHDRKWSREV